MSCHDGVQALNMSPIASLDHPTGIPYRGFFPDHPSSDVLLGPETADAPFRKPGGRPAADFRVPLNAIIDNEPVWWVETGEPGRQRTDVKLYSRRMPNADIVPFVECASCHDPHSDQRTFLRITNDESRLCFTCHDGK